MHNQAKTSDGVASLKELTKISDEEEHSAHQVSSTT